MFIRPSGDAAHKLGEIWWRARGQVLWGACPRRPAQYVHAVHALPTLHYLTYLRTNPWLMQWANPATTTMYSCRRFPAITWPWWSIGREGGNNPGRLRYVIDDIVVEYWHYLPDPIIIKQPSSLNLFGQVKDWRISYGVLPAHFSQPQVARLTSVER